jgi:hypothetical protein
MCIVKIRDVTSFSCTAVRGSTRTQRNSLGNLTDRLVFDNLTQASSKDDATSLRTRQIHEL